MTEDVQNAHQRQKRIEQLYDYSTGLSPWNVEDRKEEWIKALKELLQSERSKEREYVLGEIEKANITYLELETEDIPFSYYKPVQDRINQLREEGK